MSELNPDLDYNLIINRIKQIYDTMSDEEKAYLRIILEEISNYGYSDTYKDVWLADYKEIPVDKTTFLTDSRYLGNSNNNGKNIYPAWLETMQELERAGNQYYEIVFTGATRTGKTSTAVSDAAYALYRLMCLRNPQEYFGLKAVTRISVFFFNITSTLAKGVAFKEFNTTLSVSPWFLEHGHFTQSESNPIYVPEGGLIEVTYGSDASHALGKATFCLVGSTNILTDSGIEKLQNLVGQCKVAQITPDGKMIYVDSNVAITKFVTDTIRITLEDGSIIEGTADHKVMLSDGTYKELGNLTEDDEIRDFCEVYNQ